MSVFLLGYFHFDIGKRQAEEEVKAVSAKKQKVEEVAAKQKALKVVKKEESSLEESSEESEDEVLYFTAYALTHFEWY
jgi:hypothetical protein